MAEENNTIINNTIISESKESIKQYKNVVLGQVADFVRNNASTDKDCQGGKGKECICDDFETTLIRVIREEFRKMRVE